MRAIRSSNHRNRNFLQLSAVSVLLVFAVGILLWKLLSIFNEKESPQPQLSHPDTPTEVLKNTPFESISIPTGFPAQDQRTLTIAAVAIKDANITISESELIQGINTYRKAHNKSTLKTNEGLCQEARVRAQELYHKNIGRPPPFLLGHEGFFRDLQNGTLSRVSGLNFFGENVASSNCKRISDRSDVYVTNATQLVEWCFDASEEHRENLLRIDWTDVCSSGQYPFYVEIFGK